MDKPSVCRIKSAVAGEGMEREGADPFALSDLSLSRGAEKTGADGVTELRGQPHFGGKGGSGIESEIKFAFHVNRA